MNIALYVTEGTARQAAKGKGDQRLIMARVLDGDGPTSPVAVTLENGMSLVARDVNGEKAFGIHPKHQGNQETFNKIYEALKEHAGEKFECEAELKDAPVEVTGGGLKNISSLGL